MADKGIVTKADLYDLADSIRIKAGSIAKMSIKAMKTAVDGIQTGSDETIIRVGKLPVTTTSVEGTAVPGSGVVKKLYFNTKLPPLEVKEILDSLEFVTIDLLPFPTVAVIADSTMAEGVLIAKIPGVQQDGVSEGVSYIIAYNNTNDIHLREFSAGIPGSVFTLAKSAKLHGIGDVLNPLHGGQNQRDQD
jgi:hypothetical protein